MSDVCCRAVIHVNNTPGNMVQTGYAMFLIFVFVGLLYAHTRIHGKGVVHVLFVI